jgi:16S rRNA (cytidine1402-2'-O)-methyltransferase
VSGRKKPVGLMSEEARFSVADPGADVVAIAMKGIRVIPLVSPSSILIAMMAE